MENSIDIVALIESNPIAMSNLDGDQSSVYSKLISKVSSKFTTEEQKMFLASFYCHVIQENKSAFVVDFDSVWKWCGFSRRDPAKRLLLKCLEENVDWVYEKAAPEMAGAAFYEEEPEESIKKAAPPESGAAFCKEETEETVKEKNLGGAGKNKETIMLTVKAFKKFCMKAGTKRSDEIHDYYINLEEVLHETLVENNKEMCQQLRDSQKLLENAEKLLENNISKKEKSLIDNFDNKPVVYIAIAEPGIVKFGISNGIRTRMSQHKREIGPQFTLEYVIETIYNREVENLIKEQFKKVRIEKEYISKYDKTKTQTELVQLSDTFTIEIFYEAVLHIKNEVNNEFVAKLINELSELKLKFENAQLTINELESKIKEKGQQVENVSEEKNKIIIQKEKELKNLLKLEKNIIKRDIDTGAETKYEYNISDKCSTINVSTHSLEDNYLNKPNHIKGFTFREEGMPYWKPPQNYNYIRNSIDKKITKNKKEDEKKVSDSTNKIIIKAIHKITKEVHYYASISEAALILKLSEKGNIDKSSARKKVEYISSGKMKGSSKDKYLSQFTWSRLKSCGFLVYPDGIEVCIEENEEN